MIHLSAEIVVGLALMHPDTPAHETWPETRPEKRPVAEALFATAARARLALCLLLLSGALAGCETGIDPATGETRTVFTIPGTQANAEMSRQRWQQCIMFRSESFCDRDVPGGRPPNTPVAGGSLPGRETDP